MAFKEFPVEVGHIMMFARAVGDHNPIYHDEEYAATTEVGSIIAPPTFITASAQFDPDYVMRPRPGVPWMGSGRNPSSLGETPPRNGGGTGLHAEQHYEYMRPLRPGDVLTGTSYDGRVWTKEGRRGGTMTFRESVTDYHDSHGELVLRARGVTVRTAHPVKKEADSDAEAGTTRDR